MMKTIIRSPAHLLVGALVLGILGTTLLSITADEGGYHLYHPFDYLGLTIDAVAGLLLIISGWRFFRH